MITVVCPVYNEEKFIGIILNFFLKSNPVEKELFVIDGGSTDSTIAIVLEYVAKNKNIFLLNNPNKIVPFALNIAIKQSKGNPIVRLDAHTEYANDYFEKIIKTFETSGADIVGGPMRAIGKTNFQKAVAYATSTKMGVGDSQFHNENAKGFVDSVYLGAWKREIFSDVGYFDEQMKRNQDDEFHYRAKSKGKKIYLNPEIKSWYYPRNSFSKLFTQYFQYGLYKPLVLKKVKTEIKLRHIIPSLFVTYLVCLPILYLIFGSIVFLPAEVYFLLAVCFPWASSLTIQSKLIVPFIYPALHISYGTGFLLGLFKK